MTPQEYRDARAQMALYGLDDAMRANVQKLRRRVPRWMGRRHEALRPRGGPVMTSPLVSVDCLSLDQVRQTVDAWCALGGGTFTLERLNGATAVDLTDAVTFACLAATVLGYEVHQHDERTRERAVITLVRRAS